ncbi:MAG: hypothetical protein WBA24_15550, partial [Geitlerinemataceae cyanobacterium]
SHLLGGMIYLLLSDNVRVLCKISQKLQSVTPSLELAISGMREYKSPALLYIYSSEGDRLMQLIGEC